MYDKYDSVVVVVIENCWRSPNCERDEEKISVPNKRSLCSTL